MCHRLSAWKLHIILCPQPTMSKLSTHVTFTQYFDTKMHHNVWDPTGVLGYASSRLREQQVARAAGFTRDACESRI